MKQPELTHEEADLRIFEALEENINQTQGEREKAELGPTSDRLKNQDGSG
jgi:hypothetical protein